MDFDGLLSTMLDTEKQFSWQSGIQDCRQCPLNTV